MQDFYFVGLIEFICYSLDVKHLYIYKTATAIAQIYELHSRRELMIFTDDSKNSCAIYIYMYVKSS